MSHPYCAAVRPKSQQKGSNVCESCGGNFKTCYGSYGYRRISDGDWSSGSSSDLSCNPESPNKRYCSEQCEDEVRSLMILSF